MSRSSAIEHARQVKRRHEDALLGYPGVVSVGIGQRQRAGAQEEQVCIVVCVAHKRPSQELPPGALLPRQVEGVPIDVQEAGLIRGLEHTDTT